MITKDQFLNIGKDDTIELSYNSAMREGAVTLKPTAKARYSNKYKLYKLTLNNVNNVGGVKYYGYLRNGNNKPTFAIGNMAITVNNIKITNK